MKYNDHEFDPVTDEELTLTTTLFNSEDTDATIKSEH